MTINSILIVNILQLIQDYGFTTTILLLGLFVTWMIIKNLVKRNREYEKKIDSLYNSIDDMMKKSKSDENHELTGKFISYAENANKIQIQLYHLLQNFGSERVSIYEFHNGGKNLAGVEFKKCSNTYEAVSLETRPMIREMQSLPLSINPLWSKILVTREDIDIPSVDQIEDKFFKSYLESQSIKAYYSVILQDYDNTPIGFITLEYYKNSRELTLEQFEEFNEIAIKISGLINIK